jgi:short-subunit dehydrogenase
LASNGIGVAFAEELAAIHVEVAARRQALLDESADKLRGHA